MTTNKTRWGALVLALVLLATALSVGANAQFTDFALHWWTTDGGGGTEDGEGWMESADGIYALEGTIGQPDAKALNSAPYSLVGGFWGGASSAYDIYLPLVLRGYP